MLTRDDPKVEAAGRLLYERLILDLPPLPHLRGGKIPQWQAWGNSTIQDLCRRAAIDCSETLYPMEQGSPRDIQERLILEKAIERMGWPEINAFNAELRRGQDVREDAGGFFMRAIRRLFGLGTTLESVETYQSAAQRMIDKAWENQHG